MKNFFRESIDLDARRIDIAYSTRGAGPMNPVAEEFYQEHITSFQTSDPKTVHRISPTKAGNNERRANRAHFFKNALSLEDTMIAMPKLGQSSVVKYASAPNAFFEHLICDGAVTEVPGLGVAIYGADCAPIVIASRVSDYDAVLAVLHGGWRNIVGGIVDNAYQLIRRLGGSIAESHIWIGPTIQSCCFEVGPDVASKLDGQHHDGHVMMSLPDIVRKFAEDLGVNPLNIRSEGSCTKCRVDEKGNPVYFSRRRDGLQDPANNNMVVAVIR